MENPIKMDDLGGFPPIFGNIHIQIPFPNPFFLKDSQLSFPKPPALNQRSCQDYECGPDLSDLSDDDREALEASVGIGKLGSWEKDTTNQSKKVSLEIVKFL